MAGAGARAVPLLLALLRGALLRRLRPTSRRPGRRTSAVTGPIAVLAGLFEQPYADAKYAEKITGNAEARALALEAARKSVVLLKNHGVLPLRADA